MKEFCKLTSNIAKACIYALVYIFLIIIFISSVAIAINVTSTNKHKTIFNDYTSLKTF